MRAEKRGVQHLKTMAGLVDGRRIRTSAGALLELSMLAIEKQRLGQETSRAERRCHEIEQRVAEIASKSERLQRFVEKHPQGATAAVIEQGPSPLQVHVAPSGSLRRRVLSY